MPVMVVLGDSILWGQGLEEADKCTFLFRNAWSDAIDRPVEHRRFAHSGADIWNDGQSGILAELNPDPPRVPADVPDDDKVLWAAASLPTEELRDPVGEIPNDQPYLFRQIVDARLELGPEKRVDLVVVDMGINDTAVFDLVVPGKNKHAVVERAKSLEPRIRGVLSNIRRAFPTAKILVTGYYPVVSDQSDLDKIKPFVSLVVDRALEERANVPFWEKIAKIPLVRDLEHALFKLLDKDLATRNDAWANAMNDLLRDEVAAFTAIHGKATAAFVDPGFGPDNAIFAPKTLLWDFDGTTPKDRRLQHRKDWCAVFGLTGFEQLVVECASMGHPSEDGARRYYERLVEVARSELKLF